MSFFCPIVMKECNVHLADDVTSIA